MVESVNHCGILASSRKVSNPSQHSVKVKGSLLLSSETDSGLIHRQSSPSLLDFASFNEVYLIEGMAFNEGEEYS